MSLTGCLSDHPGLIPPEFPLRLQRETPRGWETRVEILDPILSGFLPARAVRTQRWRLSGTAGA